MDQDFAAILLEMIRAGSFDNYQIFVLLIVIVYFLRGSEIMAFILKMPFKHTKESQEKPDDSEDIQTALESLKKETKTSNNKIINELENITADNTVIIQLLKELKRLLIRSDRD